LAVGGDLVDGIAVPVDLDRLHEVGAVQAGGEVFLGVQAAAFAQGGDDVGGDGAGVESLGAVFGDGAQRFRQRRVDEAITRLGR
jgi:hypothetical protein